MSDAAEGGGDGGEDGEDSTVEVGTPIGTSDGASTAASTETPPLGERKPLRPLQLQRGAAYSMVSADGFKGEGGCESGDRTATTQVVSWGRGEDGQLMVGDQSNHNFPQPVDKLRHYRVVDVACNMFHTLAVTDTGELFACGANDEGQIIVETATTAVVLPMRVESLAAQQVVAVAAGLSHSVALLANHTVVSFGNNEYGQLGHTPDKAFRVAPRMVRGLGSNKVPDAANL